MHGQRFIVSSSLRFPILTVMVSRGMERNTFELLTSSVKVGILLQATHASLLTLGLDFCMCMKINPVDFSRALYMSRALL